MRFWTTVFMLFAVVFTLCASAVPGFTSSERDWDDCIAFDFDRKIASCTRIIEDRDEVQSNRARAYNFRGNARRQKGELDAALADYDEAIRLNPAYAFPHNGRGLTWRAKGDLDRAIADFDEAISLDARYHKTYNNRGDAWRAKGELDRALADFDQAITLEPNYALAFFNRALTWRAKGELDSALADLDQAVRIAPDYLYAYFNRGLIWRAKGELDRAIADLDAAIRLDPTFDTAYFNRGLTRLYAHGPAAALADVERASSLDPTDPYFALWSDIIGQRVGAPIRLTQAIGALDMTRWPAPVLRLFLGQSTPAALLGAADEPDEAEPGRQTCEASFYAGLMLFRLGEAGSALMQYRLAANRCPAESIERYAANAELERAGR